MNGRAHFGGFFDDVLNVVEAPFVGAGDAITSFVKAVPGGGWVASAFDSGKSWIGDMARTPFGLTALTLISGQLEIGIGGAAAGGGTALAIGPQIASVAWGLPGFLRGDCFSQAYVAEFGRRLKQLAEYFGGAGLGDSMAAEIDQLVNDSAFRDIVQAAKAQGAALGVNVDTKTLLKKAGADPNSLAKRFGTRADSAANATNLVLCEPVYDTKDFDLPSGQAPVGFGPVNPTQGGVGQGDKTAAQILPVPLLKGAPNATEILTAILLAQKAGVTDDRLQPLIRQYNTVFTQEAAMAAGATNPNVRGVLVSSPGFSVKLLGAAIASTLVMTSPAWGAWLFTRSRFHRTPRGHTR